MRIIFLVGLVLQDVGISVVKQERRRILSRVPFWYLWGFLLVILVFHTEVLLFKGYRQFEMSTFGPS